MAYEQGSRLIKAVKVWIRRTARMREPMDHLAAKRVARRDHLSRATREWFDQLDETSLIMSREALRDYLQRQPKEVPEDLLMDYIETITFIWKINGRKEK